MFFIGGLPAAIIQWPARLTAGTSPRRTLTAGGIQHHIEIAKQGIKPLPLMDNPHSGQPRRLVL
jgi:hypothetical protein